jgi:hypothetical protein
LELEFDFVAKLLLLVDLLLILHDSRVEDSTLSPTKNSSATKYKETNRHTRRCRPRVRLRLFVFAVVVMMGTTMLFAYGLCMRRKFRST